MQYTKLLVLSVVLLSVSGSVFAADLTQLKRVRFKYGELGAYLYGGKYFDARVPSTGTLGDLVEEFVKIAPLPEGFNITRIYFGEGMVKGSGLYGGTATLFTFKKDTPYTKDEFDGARNSFVLVAEQSVPQKQVQEVPMSMPSSSSSSSSTPTIREVVPQWFEATSKKAYFMNKYKALEPVVGFDNNDYNGFTEFKDEPVYKYLRDTIMTKMAVESQSAVIDGILKRTAEGIFDDYRLLMKLVQPATIRAIAAYQKLCGNGPRLKFQFDEYDINSLEKLPIPNPLIRKFRLSNGVPVDMTIYRFLYNVISELDDVPVVKDSPLYKVLDRFEHSLTEIKDSRVFPSTVPNMLPSSSPSVEGEKKLGVTSQKDAGMGTVQIKDKFLKKDMELAVPKRGKAIDILNAYRKKVSIPENRELVGLLPEGAFEIMGANDSYTTENLSTGWIMPVYEEKE